MNGVSIHESDGRIPQLTEPQNKDHATVMPREALGHLQRTRGVVDGLYRHFVTEFPKHLSGQLPVGLVGQWWHDTRGHFLGNWR